jgi:hypothetical protein
MKGRIAQLSPGRFCDVIRASDGQNFLGAPSARRLAPARIQPNQQLRAGRREHLDRRHLHIVRGLRRCGLHVLCVFHGDGGAGDLDLVADVRSQVGGRRHNPDGLWPVPVMSHSSAGRGVDPRYVTPRGNNN